MRKAASEEIWHREERKRVAVRSVQKEGGVMVVSGAACGMRA